MFLLMMSFMDKPQRPMKKVFMNKPRKSLHCSNSEEYDTYAE
jgi:hypothetical protein